MEGTPLKPGNGRLEVRPKKERKYDFFLHFLYPCDRDATGVMPDTREIESSDQSLKGLETGRWTILFQNYDHIKAGTQFTVSPGATRQILIFGLAPKNQYELSIKLKNGTLRTKDMRASENGSISFPCQGNARIGIRNL